QRHGQRRRPPMSHAESRRELHARHVSVRRRARSEHLRRHDPITDETNAVATGSRPPLRSVVFETRTYGTAVWNDTGNAPRLFSDIALTSKQKDNVVQLCRRLNNSALPIRSVVS